MSLVRATSSSPWPSPHPRARGMRARVCVCVCVCARASLSLSLCVCVSVVVCRREQPHLRHGEVLHCWLPHVLTVVPQQRVLYSTLRPRGESACGRLPCNLRCEGLPYILVTRVLPIYHAVSPVRTCDFHGCIQCVVCMELAHSHLRSRSRMPTATPQVLLKSDPDHDTYFDITTFDWRPGYTIPQVGTNFLGHIGPVYVFRPCTVYRTPLPVARKKIHMRMIIDTRCCVRLMCG